MGINHNTIPDASCHAPSPPNLYSNCLTGSNSSGIGNLSDSVISDSQLYDLLWFGCCLGVFLVTGEQKITKMYTSEFLQWGKKNALNGFSMKNPSSLQLENSVSKPVCLWLKGSKETRRQLRSIVKSLSVLSDENTPPLRTRTWKLTVMINIHFPHGLWECWLTSFSTFMVPNTMYSIYWVYITIKKKILFKILWISKDKSPSWQSITTELAFHLCF